MKSVERSLHKVIIDEQMLLVPHTKEWDLLMTAITIDDYPLAVRNLFKYNLEFVRQYNHDLTIGLYLVGTPGRAWLHVVLLKNATGWQRVHLERLTCDVCEWQGMTANPMIPDLYYGLPNWQVVRRAAKKHPVVPCPCCKNALPRHPIWTEGCI